jgi:hypothetical protein
MTTKPKDDVTVMRVITPPPSLRDGIPESGGLLMNGSWSDACQHDYDNLLHGCAIKRPESGWVPACLRELGYTWQQACQQACQAPQTKRMHLCNEVVRMSRRKNDKLLSEIEQEALGSAVYRKGATGGGHDARGTMAQMMLTMKDHDTFLLPGTKVEVAADACKKVLLEMYKLTPESYAALPWKKQNRIYDEMMRTIKRCLRKKGVIEKKGTLCVEDDEAQAERTRLHAELRAWAIGDLRLEHPQGSSYHHLVDYDATHGPAPDGSNDTMRELTALYGEPEKFVVERDWARAFSGYDLSEGECPMPFEHCVFEFRISGVRVLAFTREESGVGQLMYCVYGRGGVWVVDDYCYVVDGPSMRRETHHPKYNIDRCEFPRVNRLVWDNIRVAVIMVDADIAESTRREPGDGLNKKRQREGRPPLRNHYVIDLKRRHRPSSNVSGHVARAGVGGYRQRGHFRRGNWFHYDNPESGKVVYVDDGGFFKSRTWRSWYFAGDPENVIEKEYRL